MGTETKVAVPAYFHPETRPADWARLAALGPALGFAVMNPDSGPGPGPDPAYHPVIRAVTRAGGRVIGYVDTGYGRRPSRPIVRELAAYRAWYGLTGVFFDQVPSAAHQVGHYRRLAAAARRIGLDFVVMNPGVIPWPGFAEVADVLVTFEGAWSAYGDYPSAESIRDHPRERFCHLIHSAGGEALATARAGAEANHIGMLYTTELTGSNPWAALCSELSGPENPEPGIPGSELRASELPASDPRASGHVGEVTSVSRLSGAEPVGEVPGTARRSGALSPR